MSNKRLGALQERLQSAYNCVLSSGKGFKHSKKMSDTEHSTLAFYEGMVESISYLGLYIRFANDKVYVHEM